MSKRAAQSAAAAPKGHRNASQPHLAPVATGNLHPYAWEDPSLWAEVFAYTTDRAQRTTQATRWGGHIARLTEESFAGVVQRRTQPLLVLTFARWCGQVAEFLQKADLAAVSEQLRTEDLGNVTLAAFESSKVHLPRALASLIPGRVHWLNLVLYMEPGAPVEAVRFGDWFGVRARGATTADIVEFLRDHCGRRAVSVSAYDAAGLSQPLIPYSAASPAKALEWSAASLLGSDVSEAPQVPLSAPCTLCVLGHSSACTRCSSRVLVRYGTMLEEHMSVAKYISAHLGANHRLMS